MFKDETGEIVPAIVSEEIWERAQVLLDRKSQVFAEGGKIVNFKGTYTYSGRIMCEEHRQSYCRSIYRNKRKDGSVKEREIWQCLSYVKQGRKACSKPTLYTDELNIVMVDVVNTILENKSKLTEEIRDICQEASRSSDSEGLIRELQNDIEQVKKRRDKLLDILLAGRINDTEFDARNKTMSDEIEEKELRISQINSSAKRRGEFIAEGERLCEAIEKVVTFAGGFNRAIVDTIVDLILVKTESTKELVYLDVYLRCQNHDDPTRFAKSGDALLLFKDQNQISRRIADYSSEFSSIFLSPEHWSQQDRSENLPGADPIFLPKKA